MRPRVLVLCTANSCRSQMAAAWIRLLLGDQIDVRSAGTIATQLNPGAVAVMREVGCDLSGFTSKAAASFHGEIFDLVVTVCDSARDACPWFHGARRQIHLGFPDPVSLPPSGADGRDEFRRVRDAIRARLVPRVAKELGIDSLPEADEQSGTPLHRSPTGREEP